MSTNLARYSPPTEWDKWPKGTICRVYSTLGPYVDTYIQESDDEENPRWERKL